MGLLWHNQALVLEAMALRSGEDATLERAIAAMAAAVEIHERAGVDHWLAMAEHGLARMRSTDAAVGRAERVVPSRS